MHFLELFAGAGGLTAAVRRLHLPAFEPQDLLKPDESGFNKHFDLSLDEHFKELRSLIRKGNIRWLHGAPPCKTFSRARRSDKLARARVLRSDEVPEGFEPKPQIVKEANLLASRMARLARCVYKAGGWFSIENPEASLMWKFSPLVSLASLPGVSLLTGDQCALGGFYTKPTGWLSNAPWLNVVCKRCPPEHPKHQPLMGFAETFDGRQVWMTELAAEYSEGLCDALAAAYSEALRSAPLNSPPKRTVLETEGAAFDTEGPTKRVRREIEADESVGGLRNPARSLPKIPGWSVVGPRVRTVLESFVSRHWLELQPIIETLGSDEPIEPSDSRVHELRRELASALGLNSPHEEPEGLQAWLFKGLLEAAGDPETEVPKWLATFTPLGILEPIIPSGIFPACAPRSVGPELDRVGTLSVSPYPDGFKNYTSYSEHQVLADAAMLREVQRGFAETGDISELTARYGPLVLSKIACIVSSKDGKQKVRLIHDLRRSAVNARILLRERLVLPRICDVVVATLDLMENGFDAEHLSFLVADFSDAFKMLRTHPNERRFLAGRALNTYFVFTTVLFGVGTGPLVWCRVAAAMMRITQATLGTHSTRLACFMDDPILVLGGTGPERASQALQALLLWCALGARVAWGKGNYGNSVQWIGGQLSFGVTHGQRSTEENENSFSSLERFALTVSLPAHKVQALLEELRSISASPRGMVYRERLRSLAGLGSWIAGLAPQVKPFIRQIWAAISSCTKSGASPKLVYRKQIAAALHWLELFALGNQGGLSKTFFLEDRFRDGIVLVCDASLWGGGAACWASASEYYNNVPPNAYMSVKWTAHHEQMLNVTIGDPSHQGTFEAYTFLLAATRWVSNDTRGRVILIGDALGVMYGVVTLSAKSEIVNKIAMELALHLAPLCVSMQGIHIWGEENDMADALSRLFSPARVSIPASLANVPRHFPAEKWLSLGVQQVR